MIRTKSEARPIYNNHEEKEASILLFSFQGDKTNGCNIHAGHVPSYIDADEEQAIWEDYIRHGCTNAKPSKMVIA